MGLDSDRRISSFSRVARRGNLDQYLWKMDLNNGIKRDFPGKKQVPIYSTGWLSYIKRLVYRRI